MAGWVNRSQQDVIDYLQAEDRILRERLGGRRVRFADAERCRLAAVAKRVGRDRRHGLLQRRGADAEGAGALKYYYREAA